MPSRPGNYLDWVPSGSPLYIADPTVGQKATGWVASEAPPFQYWNWQVYYTDQWIQWFDFITQGNLPSTTVVLVTTGTTVLNSTTVTALASTAGVQAGLAVSGPGLASGTYVEEVFGTTVILSKPAIANLVGTALTFGHYYALGATVQVQLDQLDAAVSRNRPYDIVIGSGNDCDYPTLTAALADTTIGAGKRVLLLENQILAATVTLSKAFWRITAVPGVTLTDGGAGTAFSITAKGVEIEGVRFVNFTTAMIFQVGGVNGRALNNWYNNVTTEVDDSAVPGGKKPTDLGGQTE